MSLSMVDVCAALEGAGLKYRLADQETVTAGFGGMDAYRNSDGLPVVGITIQLREGRLKIAARHAWTAPGNEHRSAVLETCLRLQWKYFAIRFEFDHTDGELCPAFDFHPGAVPVAGAVPMYLRAFLHLIDEVHPHLDAAITSGQVFVEAPGVDDVIEAMGSLSPDQIRALLDAIRTADAA